MSDLVPPLDGKDAFETAHVEGLQSLYVMTIWGPCLATIQEDRNANGFDFGASDSALMLTLCALQMLVLLLLLLDCYFGRLRRPPMVCWQMPALAGICGCNIGGSNTGGSTLKSLIAPAGVTH